MDKLRRRIDVGKVVERGEEFLDGPEALGRGRRCGGQAGIIAMAAVAIRPVAISDGRFGRRMGNA